MSPSTTHSRFQQRMRELARDERGISAIVVALLAASLIGVVGLGVEAGLWFTDARGLQTQADAAAIAGAYQYAAGASSAIVTSTGTTEAVNNGFVNSLPNTISVTETTFGGNSAVQAVLTAPQTPTLLSVFARGSTVNVSATAVAAFSHPLSPCVLSLDTTANDKGVYVKGSGTVSLPGCLMASNTPGTDSIHLQGGSGLNVTVGNLYMTGTYSSNGSGTYSTSPTSGLLPFAGQPAMKNPFSSYTVSQATLTSINCNVATVANGGNLSSASLNGPGRYCDGIALDGALSTGTYYVDGGANNNQNISFSNAPSGTGVTIVFTSSTQASKIPQLNISGNPNVTGLSAPTTITAATPYKGVVFFQDPAAATCGLQGNKGCNGFTGTGTFNVYGAFYFPSQSFELNGNTSTTCTIVVAYEVMFSGNSSLNDAGCSNYGITLPIVQSIKLVV